ncbi:MAG: hypothetical protein IJG58_01960 [Oscillospiraceae bacterium]|nr:hypothetical protein [Oscillospiraceae bacterium]
MKQRKKLLCLLLVLLLAASLAPAAFAEFIFSGDEQNIIGEYDSTVFLAGENPNSAADVKGILFEAGNTVTSAGFSEYAFVAGNTVSFAGENSGDAFVGGNAVSFSGSCGRDLAIAGNSVDIRGSVGRDLLAGGRSVSISGHVGGDVTLAAEEIRISDNAEIEGILRYNSSAKISAPADLLAAAVVYEDNQGSQDIQSILGTQDAPAAQDAQDAQNVQDTQDAQNSSEDSGANVPAPEAPKPKSSPVLAKLKSTVFKLIGLLLIAYFFLWLTPLWEKVDADYTGKPFGTYAKAFGIGLAVLAALPLASIILFVSGVGVRPALVLIFVVVAALIAAPVFLGFFLGVLLWRKALKKERNYWAELAIGLVCWAILAAVPGIRVAVKMVAGCLGVGVPACMLGKKKTAAPPAVQAVAVEAAEKLPAPEENASTLLPPTDKT